MLSNKNDDDNFEHLKLSIEKPRGQLLCYVQYLKKHHNSVLVFDPSYPSVKFDTFPKHDWTKFHGYVKEVMLPDITEPLGKELLIRFFVDANHAGEKLTHRSRSVFIILLQMSPIYYSSKRQNTVETTTFGSEFKQSCA